MSIDASHAHISIAVLRSEARKITIANAPLGSGTRHGKTHALRGDGKQMETCVSCTDKLVNGVCPRHGEEWNQCQCGDCMDYTNRFSDPYMTHADCKKLGDIHRGHIFRCLDEMSSR